MAIFIINDPEYSKNDPNFPEAKELIFERYWKRKRALLQLKEVDRMRQEIEKLGYQVEDGKLPEEGEDGRIKIYPISKIKTR